MMAKTPLPGRTVRGSSTGRPVMALLDLLGRRWTLRVLWELRDTEGLTFRDLQARCGDVSSSVLATRLRELGGAGLVENESGYRLTAQGADLLQRLEPVDEWARTKWKVRSAR
jgi:DNA-binding HxlR family transcriptional regulator